jgi:hypothetical protein
MTDKEIILECPHCNGVIIVLEKQLNCKIFRHGIFKKNGNQIDPHLKKEECEMLIRDKKIWGCGKPFKVIESIKDQKKIYKAEICDYI